MLVLTRRSTEEVIVDGPCTIQILSVRGDKVRIGFKAPDGTTVVRAELMKKEGANERNQVA
jgi:carbon storage regulator CsrA